MTPLSDALTAAQQRALSALGKAYVGGQVEREAYIESLKACGVTDPVDLAYLLASLDVLREWGAPVPAETNGKPEEPMSDKQRGFIDQLVREKNVTAPDLDGLTKAKASDLINELQAGTYDPQKWQIPF